MMMIDLRMALLSHTITVSANIYVVIDISLRHFTSLFTNKITSFLLLLRGGALFSVGMNECLTSYYRI